MTAYNNLTSKPSYLVRAAVLNLFVSNSIFPGIMRGACFQMFLLLY